MKIEVMLLDNWIFEELLVTSNSQEDLEKTISQEDFKIDLSGKQIPRMVPTKIEITDEMHKMIEELALLNTLAQSSYSEMKIIGRNAYPSLLLLNLFQETYLSEDKKGEPILSLKEITEKIEKDFKTEKLTALTNPIEKIDVEDLTYFIGKAPGFYWLLIGNIGKAMYVIEQDLSKEVSGIGILTPEQSSILENIINSTSDQTDTEKE